MIETLTHVAWHFQLFSLDA